MKFAKDLLLNRITILNENIGYLKQMQDLSLEEFLSDFRNYSTVERLLQVSIEACMDMGNHLIASNSFGKPSNYREIFEILGEKEIISF